MVSRSSKKLTDAVTGLGQEFSWSGGLGAGNFLVDPHFLSYRPHSPQTLYYSEIFLSCFIESSSSASRLRGGFERHATSLPAYMAKRRSKKRTHVGATKTNKAAAPVNTGNASVRDPKSMVIRIGASEVGSNVSKLASDVRKVMEPGTASRLRERRANRLRDYVTMCGPLGVTHLLLFSRSDSGNTNLRIALAPRGPTLHFRIDKYSLSKDVRKAQRHAKGGGKEFINPPLVRSALLEDPIHR